MNPQKLPLQAQEELFLSLVLKNKKVNEILNRGFVDEFKDWYLVSGCLNQTIWNQFTNKSIENNVLDYDFIYFDTDLSAEKEATVQDKVREKYKDLQINVDVVNQARVHLWTEKDWGLKMRPLVSCEDAIASWPATVSCVGIRKEVNEYVIMAPYGLTDHLEMVLRPNKTTVMRQHDYEYKTKSWMKRWPELTLIPW